MKKNTAPAMATALALAATALCATSAQAQDKCGLGNGKKATGEPIPLGAIVGKTGPEDFSSSSRAAEAYFKCVNANGGIHGRPIAYTVQDDTWNPEVAAQAASKLVKDTKVVGMVGSSSFVECGANNKLYEQEGVAVVAGTGVPRACFYGKNYAAFNQGPRQSTIGAAQYIAETFKLKNITCVAPGIPGFGDWVCGGVEAWGKANGVAVKQVIFDPGQLDGNAVALQVSATKPDGVVLGMPRGMMLPILTAAEQQDMGKTIKWGLPTSAYHTEMPKAAGKYWDGKLHIHMELQPLDQDGPDTRNWKAIMAKYGDKKDPIDSFSQAGHLSARVATDALLGIKGPIDRKSVHDAFKAVKNVRSDMMCAPWYYGPGDRHQANHSGRVALLTGGSFKTQTECFQSKDADLSDVLALESKGGLVN
ncbi:ABC transporter substrate-binding protein [Sphaerotilus sp.]|uniref:ABC transporter substrate-binding protein n=1 Tax=Sphaerotilus sp. TaxID=2093942 RepID=UPI0025DC31A9|nr:ABC transporter substrate-binding protein [Sphaerotilus sp.]